MLILESPWLAPGAETWGRFGFVVSCIVQCGFEGCCINHKYKHGMNNIKKNLFLLIYFQRDATLHSLFISGKLLYMFRVVSSPIIRSTYNCIYIIWYLLTVRDKNKLCTYVHTSLFDGTYCIFRRNEYYTTYNCNFNLPLVILYVLIITTY